MEEIQQLNREYRGKDIPTDVLSFPLGENGVYDVNHDTGAYLLGDVVICMIWKPSKPCCRKQTMPTGWWADLDHQASAG